MLFWKVDEMTRLTDDEFDAELSKINDLVGQCLPILIAEIARLYALERGIRDRAGVHVWGRDGKWTVVEMVLSEGRNRQIRRMWAALGRRVKRLVRVAVGGLELGELAAGECRELSAAEIAALA